jgi:hypothetical protein
LHVPVTREGGMNEKGCSVKRPSAFAVFMLEVYVSYIRALSCTAHKHRDRF